MDFFLGFYFYNFILVCYYMCAEGLRTHKFGFERISFINNDIRFGNILNMNDSNFFFFFAKYEKNRIVSYPFSSSLYCPYFSGYGKRKNRKLWSNRACLSFGFPYIFARETSQFHFSTFAKKKALQESEKAVAEQTTHDDEEGKESMCGTLLEEVKEEKKAKEEEDKAKVKEEEDKAKEEEEEDKAKEEEDKAEEVKDDKKQKALRKNTKLKEDVSIRKMEGVLQSRDEENERAVLKGCNGAKEKDEKDEKNEDEQEKLNESEINSSIENYIDMENMEELSSNDFFDVEERRKPFNKNEEMLDVWKYDNVGEHQGADEGLKEFGGATEEDESRKANEEYFEHSYNSNKNSYSNGNKNSYSNGNKNSYSNGNENSYFNSNPNSDRNSYFNSNPNSDRNSYFNSNPNSNGNSYFNSNPNSYSNSNPNSYSNSNPNSYSNSNPNSYSNSNPNSYYNSNPNSFRNINGQNVGNAESNYKTNRNQDLSSNPTSTEMSPYQSSFLRSDGGEDLRVKATDYQGDLMSSFGEENGKSDGTKIGYGRSELSQNSEQQRRNQRDGKNLQHVKEEEELFWSPSLKKGIMFDTVLFSNLPPKCTEEQLYQILQFFGFSKTEIYRLRISDMVSPKNALPKQAMPHDPVAHANNAASFHSNSSSPFPACQAKVTFAKKQSAILAMRRMDGVRIPKEISHMWSQEPPSDVATYWLNVSVPQKTYPAELINIPEDTTEKEIIKTLYENGIVGGISDIYFSEYDSMKTAVVECESYKVRTLINSLKNLIIDGETVQIGRKLRPNQNSLIVKNIPVSWNTVKVKQHLESLGFQGIVSISMKAISKKSNLSTKKAFVQFFSVEFLSEALEKADNSIKMDSLVFEEIPLSSETFFQVFASNLPRNISKNELLCLLASKYARISTIRFPGVRPQHLKPCALVSFHDEESMSKFMLNNGMIIDNSAIHIEKFHQSGEKHTVLITYLPTRMTSSTFQDWLNMNAVGVIFFSFKLPREKNSGYAVINFEDEASRDEFLSRSVKINYKGTNILLRRSSRRQMLTQGKEDKNYSSLNEQSFNNISQDF